MSSQISEEDYKAITQLKMKLKKQYRISTSLRSKNKLTTGYVKFLKVIAII
jgi:hypothetical protein